MIYLSDMYWRFKTLLPSTLFRPKLFPNMQKKNSWEKHKNFGGFKAWNSWRRQGREEVTNQTELGESTNIHVASAEVASRGVEVPPMPEGVFSSVRLHLLEALSHVDVSAWPAIPLLFLFLYFLNIMIWRLCFLSIGLERKEVMLCPHLHIHTALHFSFFLFSFCFSFSSSSSLPLFFQGLWQFAFPGVEARLHLLLRSFETIFS